MYAVLHLRDAEGNEWMAVASLLGSAAPKGERPSLKNVVGFLDLPRPVVVTELKVIES